MRTSKRHGPLRWVQNQLFIGVERGHEAAIQLDPVGVVRIEKVRGAGKGHCLVVEEEVHGMAIRDAMPLIFHSLALADGPCFEGEIPPPPEVLCAGSDRHNSCGDDLYQRAICERDFLATLHP